MFYTSFILLVALCHLPVAASNDRGGHLVPAHDRYVDRDLNTTTTTLGLDVSECVPLAVAHHGNEVDDGGKEMWEDSNIRLTYAAKPPLHDSANDVCYALALGSRIFVFADRGKTFNDLDQTSLIVVNLHLPADASPLSTLGALEEGLKQYNLDRKTKRSPASAAADAEDYDYNHLLPEASHLTPPDFGFELASPLAQSGRAPVISPGPVDSYQNDEEASAGSLPYQVDRRTQILPVAADGPEAQPVRTGAALETAQAGASAQLSNFRPEPARAPGSRPPTLRNPLDQIKVDQGKIFRIAVPANTFHDQADGDTRNLKLELYTIDKRPVATDKKYSWITFDPASQQFYGLPGPTHVGLHEFILAAVNRAGLPVYNAFTIYVNPRPKGYRHSSTDPGINHRFWVVMDAPNTMERSEPDKKVFGSSFRNFRRNVTEQIAFFDSLISYYASTLAGSASNHTTSVLRLGEIGPAGHNLSSYYDHIFLDSIERGSIRVSWINDSLLSSSQGLPLELLAESVRARGNNNYSMYGCPEPDIRQVGSRFVAGSGGGPNPNFQAAMAPKYHITGAGYDLIHACEPFQTAPLAGRGKPPARGPVSRDYERDLWMTTIIPSLVMALLLLIASLIACCLYRRRRKPRFMNEDRSLFKKGVPVVMYPDEFEDSSAPQVDTHPNVTYQPAYPGQGAPQQAPSSTNPNAALLDNNNYHNGYSSGQGAPLRSPVNDPNATYPRPPPFHNQAGTAATPSSAYRPLLSHAPSDQQLPPNTTQIINLAYYGNESGPKDTRGGQLAHQNVSYNNDYRGSGSKPNYGPTNYSTLNAG